MDIGSKIKKIRKDRDITQARLAELVGVSKSRIESYEANRTSPTLDILQAICTVLGVNISNFLDFEGMCRDERTQIATNTLRSKLGMCAVSDFYCEYDNLNSEGKVIAHKIIDAINNKISALENGTLHKTIESPKLIEEIYQEKISNYLDEIDLLNSKIEIYKQKIELEEKGHQFYEKLYKDTMAILDKVKEGL